MGEPQLADLHMLVLYWIREHPAAFPEEVARAFGLDDATMRCLFDDLAVAGFIEPMTEQ